MLREVNDGYKLPTFSKKLVCEYAYSTGHRVNARRARGRLRCARRGLAEELWREMTNVDGDESDESDLVDDGEGKI